MRKAWLAGMFVSALLVTGSGAAAPPQMQNQQVGNPQMGQSQSGVGQSGQTRPSNGTSTRNSVLGDDGGFDAAARDRMQEQAARGRNMERYKRMLADTNKLLQLSTELKNEVDATTKNEMSMQVIQKAAEIEKLARDVKERMKGQ